MRYETARVNGREGVRAEIVETEYFARRIELAKHSLTSEAEVRAALDESDQ